MRETAFFVRFRGTVKRIQHNVFADAAAYPILPWKARAHRERNRERVRQQVETFINEIGVDRIVSVTEHAPAFGPFSVVVWWHQELTQSDTLVIRAEDEKQTA